MKISLISAKLRRAGRFIEAEEKKVSMARVVEKFINGPLKKEILEADSDGVNVAIPHEAYQDDDLFYMLCIEELTKLGYHATRSHDGGGMYDTIYVDWEG
jgi:hypothetical protein